MADEARQELAERLFKEAYQHQMNKELDEAVELYQRSISVYPTAEAYTFLGWTYSWMGRIDDAIAECHKAIEVDPTFGNPYNDIGSYLIRRITHTRPQPNLLPAFAATSIDSGNRLTPFFTETYRT